jgi:hypothetical protein
MKPNASMADFFTTKGTKDTKGTKVKQRRTVERISSGNR